MALFSCHLHCTATLILCDLLQTFCHQFSSHCVCYLLDFCLVFNRPTAQGRRTVHLSPLHELHAWIYAEGDEGGLQFPTYSVVWEQQRLQWGTGSEIWLSPDTSYTYCMTHISETHISSFLENHVHPVWSAAMCFHHIFSAGPVFVITRPRFT